MSPEQLLAFAKASLMLMICLILMLSYEPFIYCHYSEDLQMGELRLVLSWFVFFHRGAEPISFLVCLTLLITSWSSTAFPPRLVSLKADWPSEYCPEYDHNGGFVYSVQLSDNPARFSRMHRWCRDFCFRNMISWLSCNGNYIDARFLLAETWQIHVPRVENQRSESDQRPMHTGSQNSVPLAHMIQVVFTVYVFIVMDLCKTPTKWGLRCLLWACIGDLWQT